ncbi:Flavonoid 3'-monooxygenase [Acorus gramineus]|uniref:Flavonoid 3'-monooxygenase n=1 Tax=Acorus gramineus TaxID=55184 RepID=A0AAV9AMN5_ACOGR|nr:Flavonoid 3'-monooxygenase [Acorus gramineus]
METTLLIVVSTLFISTLLYILISTTSHRRCRLPPGPKGWPILGNLPQLGPKPHQTLATLAKIHGPILHLRLGHVHVVVASSPSAAASFLKTHDANFADRPPNSGGTHVAYNCQDLVFAPYGPRWRMLRKLCSLHLFSTKALDEFRQVREEEVLNMVRSLHGSRVNSHAVNVGKILNMCATNALSRALMGRRVFGEAEAAAEEFKEMVVELMVVAGEFNVGDFVWGLGWLDPQGVVGRMKKLHRRFDGFLDGIIKEHSMDGSDRKRDLLSVLIGLKERGEGEERLNDVDIKALLLNMFSAGTDTSSSTVEWALAELILHPDILKKAQQELDSVVGRSRLVSESDMAHLPYFHAIVKETFRLHPSTPLSIPHMASDDCHVDDYFIPKGTTLLVNVWAITHDPNVWPNPLEFDPTRFMQNGPAGHMDVKGNDFELIPFGAGRRICAGMGLGLRMVQLMMATLVHGFDWAVDGKVDMEEAYGITLQRAVPLTAWASPRLEAHVYA